LSGGLPSGPILTILVESTIHTKSTQLLILDLMKSRLLICLLTYFCLNLQAQNVTFSYTVANSGATSVVSVFARATSASGNNIMGFTSNLYYDITKATVASTNSNPIANAPNNWGTAIQTIVNHQPTPNAAVPVPHQGCFQYSNVDQNFTGTNMPLTPVLLFSVTFNILSGNGGLVYLASTTQQPALEYFDDNSVTFPVVVTGANSLPLSGAPLPVQLLHVKAQKVHKQDVLLTWRTAHEVDVQQYEVQKSQNATDWSKIGYLEAQVKGTYQFTDRAAFQTSKTNYYRLKINDLDGSHAFSQIVKEQLIATESLVITPNPSNGIFQIQFPDTKERIKELNVIDAQGRLVQQHTKPELSDGIYTLYIGTYSSGNYQIILTTESGIVYQQRMIKL
jgi:Secretion system C-terminal sorting domain